MAQATGRVEIKLNGELLRSKEGASIQTGGVTRESVTTDQGDVFYKETIVPAPGNLHARAPGRHGFAKDT